MPSIGQIQFLDALSSNISQIQEIEVHPKKNKKEKKKKEGTDAACSLAQCTAHDKVWKEKSVALFLPHQDKMYK